jgi:type 1 glutamine amidotransferase
MAGKRVNVYLICGGKYHDIDFARLELLKLLGEHEQLRVRVAADYQDCAAIESADVLITYTCEVAPSSPEEEALAGYLAAGKRWFALHGTNSVLKYLKGKGWDAPDTAPRFMDMLGSQFAAHPPIAPYRVTVSKPDHPLVRGIGPFDADDELYLCRFRADVEVLLETRFSGSTPGFVDKEWPDDVARPVLYLRRLPAGEVLYFTLGHARGRYDMQPLMQEYPQIERGSWKSPEFYEILRRGICWAARLDS